MSACALAAYARLPRARRRLVREAAWAILRAKRALRRDAAAVLREAVAREPAPTDLAAWRELAWAIQAAGSRIPGSRCLDQALAALALAGRRGLGARLCIGARKEVVLEAHAWVEVAGAVVVGDRVDLATYRPFPLEMVAGAAFD